MFRVYTDNAHNAFSFDDLAFVAHLFNRWSDFHFELLYTPKRPSLFGYDDSVSASAAGPPRCGVAPMKIASPFHRGSATSLL